MKSALRFARSFNYPSDDDDLHFDFAVVFTRVDFGYAGKLSFLHRAILISVHPIFFLNFLKDPLSLRVSTILDYLSIRFGLKRNMDQSCSGETRQAGDNVFTHENIK